MRIALIPSAFYPSLGGVEELTKNLAIHLKELGHQVIVITERWPRNLPSQETRDGLQIFRFPFRVPCGKLKPRISYALTTWAIRKQLYSLLRQFRPNVLHVQCASSNAYYAALAKKRLKIPLVLSLQGEFTMDAAGIYAKPGGPRDRLLFAMKQADRITGCSRQTLQEALQFYEHSCVGSAAGTASVIYNGVSLANFPPGPTWNTRSKTIFALGRFVPQKAFDILISAMPSVGNEYQLVLAGDGPEREPLESLTRHLDLVERVKFVGRLDPSAVSRYMRESRLFVLPSRHEPFGIVNLEAMASRTPLVATRVGGVPEILEDGVTGLLVLPENPSALAKGINAVLHSNGMDGMVGQAFERVKSFDWSNLAVEYVDAYVAAAR